MKQINVHELRDLIATGDEIALIDVREDFEHNNFNIGGQLIPLGELIARRNEIPVDKTVILYCEKGIRSVIAIQRLETLGFGNLCNLTGGMRAWKSTP